MMLTMIAGQHGPDLAAAVAEAILHSPIRHHSENQRMSLPARIGVRHPKLVSIIEKMEDNLEDPAVAIDPGQTGLAVDPPAGAPVPPIPRPVAEALLPGIASEKVPVAAVADGHVGDQRGAGLRLFFAITFFEMLPRLYYGRTPYRERGVPVAEMAD